MSIQLSIPIVVMVVLTVSLFSHFIIKVVALVNYTYLWSMVRERLLMSSLIQRRNINGPRKEPWGIPVLLVLKLDLRIYFSKYIIVFTNSLINTYLLFHNGKLPLSYGKVLALIMCNKVLLVYYRKNILIEYNNKIQAFTVHDQRGLRYSVATQQ